MPSPNINTTVTGVMTYVNSAGGSGTLGTYQIFHEDKTTVSVKTPNFRKLKRSALPLNPYSFHNDRFSDPRSSFSAVSRDNNGLGTPVTWTYSMNAGSFGCQTTHTIGTTADDPAQKAINKIIEDISLAKVNSAVALAEMNKTVAHVAHTAQRLGKAILALKKGRFGDFTEALGITASVGQQKRFYTGVRKAVVQDWKLDLASDGGLVASKSGKSEKFRFKRSFNAYSSRQESKTSNFLADSWLEYSYGWKPLLKDVYDHAKATAEVMVEHQSVWRTVKARASCERSTNIVTIPANDQVRKTFVGYSKLSVEIGIQFRIPPGAVNLSTAFGLNNPLEVAWELVPFSFVADWFLPIGDAIRGLSAYSGLEFHSGYKSHKHVRTLKATVQGWPSTISGSVKWSGQSGGAKCERYEYDQGRVLLSSFPQYGFPRFKDPRSWAHATSAVALLQSLFLRKGSEQPPKYLRR